MTKNHVPTALEPRKMTNPFEHYLTVWVILCILGGVLLGKIAPDVAKYLDGLAIRVNGAPVVSIPIAICLFFMMYPIMVKIDFASVVRTGRNVKPVLLTLFVNWAVKPFTMYLISILFLGIVFRGLIGKEATDVVKMPFGLDLPLGARHGAGVVVAFSPSLNRVVESLEAASDSIRVLQVPIWRSYLAGCILLGLSL
ncbi:MAG: hypothetical protein N2255_05665, partial [Kiritimatiellae bacterium]|nr:hypothetical protein [Kiritimatiellia bacterium]